MQNGQLSEYFLFAKNRVIVGDLVGGGQVDKRREEKEVKQKKRGDMKALPEKTLGILVRKLFTVRIGMPFFSSCMRAITSSIWTAQE